MLIVGRWNWKWLHYFCFWNLNAKNYRHNRFRSCLFSDVNVNRQIRTITISMIMKTMRSYLKRLAVVFVCLFSSLFALFVHVLYISLLKSLQDCYTRCHVIYTICFWFEQQMQWLWMTCIVAFSVNNSFDWEMNLLNGSQKKRKKIRNLAHNIC